MITSTLCWSATLQKMLLAKIFPWVCKGMNKPQKLPIVSYKRHLFINSLTIWLSIILIAIFCASVCRYVWLQFLKSRELDIVASTMLLSPTWRASPGKLCRLVLKLAQRVVGKKKPLELFCRYITFETAPFTLQQSNTEVFVSVFILATEPAVMFVNWHI